jgi:hypothetical protein
MIKRLGVVLFAKLQELAKGIAEGVSIVLQGNKKMEASSKKVSKSIEQSFGQGAKNAIKQTGEQMLIQTDILRDLEMGLKKLEEQQKSTGKYDFQAQAKIKKAIQEQTQAIADQKFALQGLKMQQQESKAALSESRAVAEDNSQAMEALGRATNAASMATLLMTGDNKKLQPTLDAIRTAMALASAGMAIYNLSLRENNVLTTISTGLQKAYAVVVGTSTGAMKLFRVALAATGVGILIVALGELVALLTTTEQNLDKVNDQLETLGKRNEYAEDSINSIIGAIERQTELDIARARLARKTESDIQKIREKSNNQIIDQINEQKRIYQESYKAQKVTIKKEIEDLAEQRKRITELDDKREKDMRAFNDRIADLQNQSKIEAIEVEIRKNEQLEEQDKKRLEKLKKKLEDERKAYEDYMKLVMDEGRQYQQFLIDQMADGKDKELAQLKFNFEQELAAVKTNNALRRGLTEKYNKDVEAINQKYANKEFDAETRRVDQAIQNAQNLARAKKEAIEKENLEILAQQEKFNQKINEQFKNALNQFTQTVVSEVSNSIKRAFEGVSESSQISLKILEMQQKELEKTMKDAERSDLERLQARQQYLKNEQDIMDATQSNMSKLFKSILLGVADFLIQLGTGLVVAATATEAFFQSLKSNPKLAIAAGLAAITAGIATKAVIERGPKFANGGIVSGPTLGLVGEYPGASTNPEVIAPLDKLQSMINGTGGGEGGYIAETRVSGRDLAIVLNRYNKDAQRG